MSNAFCSALWAADYMLKLASYGCVGVNLHGGGSKQIRDSLGGHLPGESWTRRLQQWRRRAASIRPSPAAANPASGRVLFSMG